MLHHSSLAANVYVITISTKLGDQVILQIGGKRKRIYHTYNSISARNLVTMQRSALVQTRGSMKLQQLMWKVIITRNKEYQGFLTEK